MFTRHRPAADTLSALANLDLLRDRPRRDIARLARDSDVIDVPGGVVIDRRGSVARQFVGIVDGYIRATAENGDQAVLGPGDQIGAVELLDDRRHSMAYTSMTAATLVVTFGPAFRAAARSLPGLAAAAHRDACRRAESTGRVLVAPAS